MLRLGILFFLLFSITLASQDSNSAEKITNDAAVRGEQERKDFCVANSLPTSCSESLKSTKLWIRVPEYSETPFQVACDQRSYDGGWTIILRRNDGSENFYREWKDYKHGFGQLNNEFFLGLDKIHAMTSSEPHELLVLVTPLGSKQSYELYDDFKVGPESTNYTLQSLGLASGNATDRLTYHLGMQFSTKDRKNDLSDINCATKHEGAWWYNECYYSNLCGKYGDRNTSTLKWYTDFLRRAVMLIRPKASSLKCS
ncbi:ryncolin-4-like [Drosophila gunungcola]|uniref:ryncolin-4-like n=1 Tax=Drosophila gunungcola TaxID=103775 RepID=UPI0022E38216|nr:ryncolin-4-like [Drosophila gunungcola]